MRLHIRTRQKEPSNVLDSHKTLNRAHLAYVQITEILLTEEDYLTCILKAS
jgi:hypothetical protein